MKGSPDWLLICSPDFEIVTSKNTRVVDQCKVERERERERESSDGTHRVLAELTEWMVSRFGHNIVRGWTSGLRTVFARRLLEQFRHWPVMKTERLIRTLCQSDQGNASCDSNLKGILVFQGQSVLVKANALTIVISDIHLLLVRESPCNNAFIRMYMMASKAY